MIQSYWIAGGKPLIHTTVATIILPFVTLNIKLYLIMTKDKYFLDEVDELDSNLTLTCTMIDLICELLAGIASNNTLQQEAVVRWTKLLFGNISEPILQVRFIFERILYFFHKLLINFMLIHRN